MGALAATVGLFGKGAAAVLSDALGGALDGALDAMKVWHDRPPRPPPLRPPHRSRPPLTHPPSTPPDGP